MREKSRENACQISKQFPKIFIRIYGSLSLSITKLWWIVSIKIKTSSTTNWFPREEKIISCRICRRIFRLINCGKHFQTLVFISKRKNITNPILPTYLAANMYEQNLPHTRSVVYIVYESKVNILRALKSTIRVLLLENSNLVERRGFSKTFQPCASSTTSKALYLGRGGSKDKVAGREKNNVDATSAGCNILFFFCCLSSVSFSWQRVLPRMADVLYIWASANINSRRFSADLVSNTLFDWPRNLFT